MSKTFFSPPKISESATLWDVIIVGGGPAGLSAALVLGRCRRRVLLCDAGHPRNEASRAMHGFLSRDGINPADFLRTGREQLVPYDTVELRQVKVEDVERHENSFTVLLEDGQKIGARMILLATGLTDELPELEGLKQFYGITAHTCPYCDGWEHRDQPLAVAGGNDAAADLALELLLWSRDVVLCTDGKPDYEEDRRALLSHNGVRVVETPILRLEGTGDHLEHLLFKDGSRLDRSALFFSPAQHQRSPLAERLGCESCAEDSGCIQCGEDAATCVPGVYAAGNASRGVQLVIAAAAEGAQAAHAINTALLEADQAKENEARAC